MDYENNDEAFAFDHWASLARHDPRAFEEARRALLQSLIASAPLTHRRRLAGLQWQIDRERERSDNPMASCIKVSNMMWDKVLGEGGLVDNLEQLSGVKPISERVHRQAAVLPFKRRSAPA